MVCNLSSKIQEEDILIRQNYNLPIQDFQTRIQSFFDLNVIQLQTIHVIHVHTRFEFDFLDQDIMIEIASDTLNKDLIIDTVRKMICNFDSFLILPQTSFGTYIII